MVNSTACRVWASGAEEGAAMPKRTVRVTTRYTIRIRPTKG
jgi:hypothetical protein